MFKRKFARTIPDNLRAPHMKMWGFEAKGPESSPELRPEHYHYFFITMLFSSPILGVDTLSRRDLGEGQLWIGFRSLFSGKDPLGWSVMCWLSWFSGPGCGWRPTSRASSRSLRAPPWPSICFHGPSGKFLDLLPQLPYHPSKNGTHSTCFCSTRGHTPIFVIFPKLTTSWPRINLKSLPSKWTRRVWVANCCWPPLVNPAEPLKSRLWVLWQHLTCDSSSQKTYSASTFELSQCRHCKEGLPGPRRGFWVPAVCTRPRPFAHCRLKSPPCKVFGQGVLLKRGDGLWLKFESVEIRSSRVPQTRVQEISPKFSCIKLLWSRDVLTQIAGRPGPFSV